RPARLRRRELWRLLNRPAGLLPATATTAGLLPATATAAGLLPATATAAAAGAPAGMALLFRGFLEPAQPVRPWRRRVGEPFEALRRRSALGDDRRDAVQDARRVDVSAGVLPEVVRGDGRAYRVARLRAVLLVLGFQRLFADRRVDVRRILAGEVGARRRRPARWRAARRGDGVRSAARPDSAGRLPADALRRPAATASTAGLCALDAAELPGVLLHQAAHAGRLAHRAAALLSR